jgi:hypothetical protein
LTAILRWIERHEVNGLLSVVWTVYDNWMTSSPLLSTTWNCWFWSNGHLLIGGVKDRWLTTVAFSWGPDALKPSWSSLQSEAAGDSFNLSK